MEDEGHASRFTVFGDHGFLTVPQDAGFQFDVAGLVHAVHVAESGGQHEFAEGCEGFIRHQHIFRRSVKLVGGMAGVVHSVFFSAHNADFDFKNDAQFGAFLQQFPGKLEVSAMGSVEASSMWELKRGASPRSTRRRDSAIRGRRKVSTCSGWQWSV